MLAYFFLKKLPAKSSVPHYFKLCIYASLKVFLTKACLYLTTENVPSGICCYFVFY